jgi:hypothetical protein
VKTACATYTHNTFAIARVTGRRREGFFSRLFFQFSTRKIEVVVVLWGLSTTTSILRYLHSAKTPFGNDSSHGFPKLSSLAFSGKDARLPVRAFVVVVRQKS